jgi:hydroxyquinol 1,2-dioxygenase
MDHAGSRLTDAVLASLGTGVAPRARRLLTALIGHLHAFAGEVELTEEEWLAAIRFLTAAGQLCDDRRQELILISDVLGLSMLVDGLAHRRPGATESTVLGPFHVAGAREIENGGDLAAGWPGEPCHVSGTVSDTAGRPLGGAWLDVWQADDEGLYDTQRPSYPARTLRARLRADDRGRFAFRTIRPRSYPVPTDGPAGDLLSLMGRHAYRPAHIHFIVEAPGHERLVTHLFAAGDPYLGSDAVFGVKPSLIVDFERSDSAAEAARLGVTAPFSRARHDFVLASQTS